MIKYQYCTNVGYYEFYDDRILDKESIKRIAINLPINPYRIEGYTVKSVWINEMQEDGNNGSE